MKIVPSYIKNSLFLRNFSVLTLGESVGHVINMLTNIYLARLLTPAFYGEYTLLMTYISLFYTVSALGLRQIVIRTIARNQNNSRIVFYYSVLLRLYGYVLGVIVLFVYNWISPLGMSDFLIAALLLGVFAQSFWDAFQNVAFGMQRMEWTSIINVTGSICILLTYIVLPASVISVEMVAIIYIAWFLLKDMAYLVSLYRNHLLTRDSSNVVMESIGTRKRMLKDSMPFYILSIFTMFSSQFPILFLERNSSIEEVAYFNTANKLLLPMTMLINTSLVALFPNQAQLFVENKVAFANQVKRIMSFIIGLGILLGIVITLFRTELVWVLYGGKYANTGEVMAFQCWYLVVYTIFGFIGGTMGAADRQNLLAGCSIAYAVVSVPFLFYGSYYGAQGLALAYIVASAVNMTYHYYFLNKILDNRLSRSFTIKLFSSIIIAFLAANYILCILSFWLKVLFILGLFIGAYIKRNIILAFLKSR